MEESKSNWATASMREFIFWKEGMTPEEFEKEYQHYYNMVSEGKRKEYKPLWKQK